MQRSLVERRRRTPAQREKILTAYRRSRLTQREFVAQAGISLSTLQLWLRKPAARPPANTAFVQVPNLLAPSPLPAPYRLHLPGGLILEIGSGYQSQELEGLLRLFRVL